MNATPFIEPTRFDFKVHVVEVQCFRRAAKSYASRSRRENGDLLNEWFNWLEGKVSHKMCTHNNIMLASSHLHIDTHTHKHEHNLAHRKCLCIAAVRYHGWAGKVLELNEIVYIWNVIDWLNQTKSGQDLESSSFVIVANRVDDSVFPCRPSLQPPALNLLFLCFTHITRIILISHDLDRNLSFHSNISTNPLLLLNMNSTCICSL